eukprot:jgi/Bigna1/127866/aug1.5_g2574
MPNPPRFFGNFRGFNGQTVHVGARISVFWEKEQQYIPGRVVARCNRKGKNNGDDGEDEWTIRYDNEHTYSHRLRKDKWRYLLFPTRAIREEANRQQKRRMKKKNKQSTLDPRPPLYDVLKQPPPNTAEDLGLMVINEISGAWGGGGRVKTIES